MVSSLSEILAGQMDYSYFPISVEHLEAKVRYHDLVEGRFEVGEVRGVSHYLNHPALTLGYRLEADGATVVYASDHEPHDHVLAQGGDMAENRYDLAHAGFVSGADLLIHDAQYLGEEYPARAGWGHSTVEYVVDIAATAGVGTVALYHHDPTRTDELMDDLVETAQAYADRIGFAGAVVPAREGDTIELRGDADTAVPSRWSSLPPAVSMSEVGVPSAVIFAETPIVAEVISEEARAEGLDVIVEHDLQHAFEAVRREQPGIIVAEAVDDDGGFNLVEQIRSLPAPYGPEVPIILVGHTNARWRPDAAETGITEWIVWPAKGFFIRTKMRAWLMRRAER
jgi:CheY-like chemotaxis protein